MASKRRVLDTERTEDMIFETREYTVRCDDCTREIPHFESEKDALEFAIKYGWIDMGKDVILCPQCWLERPKKT